MAALSCTDPGRAKLVAKVSKLWRWEFWPTWLFYIPVYPWIAWLAIRYRGLSIPTAANPAIPQGGIVGESKAEILAKLPSEWVLPFARLESGASDGRMALLARFMNECLTCFPVILKPDSGERGASVRLVRDESSAHAYFEQTSGPVLAQAYHPGPYEAGIFYYRMPDEPKGRIFSITDKQFSYLCGDGIHTVEQLIWKHPRFRMQARTFLKRHAANADRILKSGESLRLAEAGNHCQGTLFKDGSRLITPMLADAIDAIAREFDGFYFGRFDVRYADADLLRNGGGFQIIELNGVTSESTNIYDPAWTMLRAYRTLFRQWSILFAIGAANRARGIRSTSIMQVLAHVNTNYRLRRLDPLAD
ncbi:MAG: carboxylate--amine ligase [Planctomycetes bacterium]|nr:carboxylate--amine ligase [Planctomycetota bacterium]